MEDNEFEEVTIISHTDIASREQANQPKDVESLRYSASLETVLELVVKDSGRTYTCDDPRLAPGLRELEKLKQDHFAEFRSSYFAPFNFISRVAGESGQYLLGADGHVLLSNKEGSRVVDTGRGGVQYVLPWGDSFLVFATNRFVLVYDQQFGFVKEITAHKDAIPHMENFRSVASSYNHVFFLLHTQTSIGQLDRQLELKVNPVSANVQDFFVCPKTETITTLHEGSDGCYILRNDVKAAIQKTYYAFKFSILKKMYSDHFLVGESEKKDLARHSLHLVCDKTLSYLSKLDFQTEKWGKIGNIRLLAPRQGINCFLVSTIQTLELFCEYRLKLYHLKTHKVLSYSSCLSHITGSLWAVAGLQTTVLIVSLTL